jgi:hypothetical protein
MSFVEIMGLPISYQRAVDKQEGAIKAIDFAERHDVLPSFCRTCPSASEKIEGASINFARAPPIFSPQPKESRIIFRIRPGHHLA